MSSSSPSVSSPKRSRSGGSSSSYAGGGGGGGGRNLSIKFRSVMEDEQLCDVTLRGTDGTLVPAAKFVLAAQSPVFRRMLFGDFSESSSPIVSIGFRGAVLRLVVEYCYTDEVETLANLDSERKVRDAVSLYAAAHYFELTELQDTVGDALAEAIHDDPSLACAVLEASTEAGPLASGLRESSWRIIRQRPAEALLGEDDDDDDGGGCGSSSARRRAGNGAQSLGPEMISEVVKDDATSADELTMLRCLKLWTDAASKNDIGGQVHGKDEEEVPSSLAKKPRTEDAPVHSLVQRMALARELASGIRLDLVPPSSLVGFVSESGLVDAADVVKALREQALFAEKEGVHFVRPRAECIVVEGAGEPAVNGVYIMNDAPETRSGSASYSKSSIWKGREEIMALSRSSVKSRHGASRTWFIATSHEDDVNKNVPFYFSRNNDITKNEWAPTGEGVDPPPEVSLYCQKG